MTQCAWCNLTISPNRLMLVWDKYIQSWIPQNVCYACYPKALAAWLRYQELAAAARPEAR